MMGSSRLLPGFPWRRLALVVAAVWVVTIAATAQGSGTVETMRYHFGDDPQWAAPRRRARKAPVLLELPQIRAMLEELPEPTRSIVVLIVFGSMRVGEALALRWKRIHPDRISIVERVYDGEFDDVKTDAGERDVPLDSTGMMAAALRQTWEHSTFHGPEDLVFANGAGHPLDTHNLLNRQLKPAAVKLGLPGTVDFRSFRKMHASLLRRTGARPEVLRDNMGHAGVEVGLNIYSESWWDERVNAVSRAVAAVFAAPAARPPEPTETQEKPENRSSAWVPLFGCPSGNPANSASLSI
jgi:integrase